jgi:8-oxo-dGTP diphosphatase
MEKMIEYVFGLAVRVLLMNKEDKILILKRSANSKTNPEKWELPGGKVGRGESFDQALIREVYEETNLKIALDHVIGVSEQNLYFIRVVHVIMSGKIVDGELNLSSEHDGYAWVFFEDLRDYELADWFNDFFKDQKNINNSSKEEKENKKYSNEILKPWIGSIRTSIRKILRKK